MWLPVEQLRPGMMIETNAHGPKTIVRTAYFIPPSNSDVYRFEPGPLNSDLKDPLTLTSGHRLLLPLEQVSEDLKEELLRREPCLPLFDESFLAVPAHLDPRGFRIPSLPGEQFWGVVLEEDEPGHTYGICVNGVWIESTGADRLFAEAHQLEEDFKIGEGSMPFPKLGASNFYVTGPSIITLGTPPVPITLTFTIYDIRPQSEGGWFWSITKGSATWSSPGEVTEIFSWTLNPADPRNPDLVGLYTLNVRGVDGGQAPPFYFQVQAGVVCIGTGAQVLMAL